MMSNPLLALLLECVARSSLVAFAAAGLLFVLRVREARVRHGVWAALALWMLALPLWTAWGPRAAVRLPGAASAPPPVEAGATRAAPAAYPAPSLSAPQPAASRWPGVFVVIYFIGAIALLARLIFGALRARGLARSAVLREGRWTSAAWSVPVTVGVVHPRIILPPAWTAWPAAQLDAVLLHEQEHARRRDPLVQCVALLNRAIFWFHPLAWWLERRIAALAEDACDAVVLARGHDPARYSGYLLEMARLVERRGARLTASAAAVCSASLPGRIRRMLEEAPAPRLSRARIACVAAASAALTAIGGAGAVEPAGPAAPLAQAQTAASSASGSIFGTIEDDTGARVPNAAITVRDAAGATVASGHSGAAGAYRIDGLAPGGYSVEYSARGFALRIMSTSVAAGNLTRIDPTLDIGQIIETVEVTATRPPAAARPSTRPSAPQSGPVTVGGLVRAAHLLKQVQPVYAPELRQQGIQGTVILRATISPEGVPLNVHALNHDEVDPRLAEAAVDAVRQWRYEPARLDEEPVAVRTTIRISFSLDN